jgi:acyl-CoA reductase-like NAD-dependent aldehyde dehydrogenase
MFDRTKLPQLLINGEWVNGHLRQELREKFDQTPYGDVTFAAPEQVREAVRGARAAFDEVKLEPSERHAILTRASQFVLEWKTDIIELISNETGFTRADGDNEVRRCIQTLTLAASACLRLHGEMVPMDATPGLKHRMGFTILVPRGVVCAITPYNSPLNTVAHKLAPALAAGNAVILKPSEFTPQTASVLCQALLCAGLPPRLLALVHGPGDEVGRQLLADQDIAYYTFTGSTRVGREIHQAAGLRGAQLELGSIASTIVCNDADVKVAVDKLTNACFRKAGQVCTSVQRIFIEREIYASFTDSFVAAVNAIPCGDPREPATIVGPMISIDHAKRSESWIREAQQSGAEVLTGGTRQGALLAPTVLAKVRPEMRVVCQEIFAPCVSLVPFDAIDDAIDQVNATPYGLAVGVFTRNISTALRSAPKLRFGGIHVNETSSSRVDVMPFGGVKDSGSGREGPHYAVREMLEERLVTIAY